MFILVRLTFLLSLLLSVEAIDDDKHASCADWAAMGECESNPNFMLIQCTKSCHQAQKAADETAKQVAAVDSFFALSARDIDGNEMSFESLRGQVTVLTNVASYCGFTESHYRSLVELYGATSGKPVTILAFPCNQFGKQEPGSAADIKQFAARKGVQFKLMEKINVNGPDAHLVYKYLKHTTQTSAIGWNFATYFVVDPTGKVEAHNGVEPMDLLPLILEKGARKSCKQSQVEEASQPDKNLEKMN